MRLHQIDIDINIYYDFLLQFGWKFYTIKFGVSEFTITTGFQGILTSKNNVFLHFVH